MAGSGTDSRVRLYVLRTSLYAVRTSLHAVRTSFLVATFLWCLGAVLFVTVPLGAQAISGTLVESETGAPVEGAAVILLSRNGERLDWRLTNATGRFNFRTPGPGTYLLQAERIGHARVLSDPIPIDRGVTVVYRLETPVEAILLAGIEVESSRRCEVRPRQGLSTATVWEEARKALEATSRTSSLGVYRYMIRRYEQELDARGRRVRSEQSRILRGQALASPFRSLDVENLLENGFVRPDGEGSIYYGPDADVLLSDPFLDTHCMSLEWGEDEAEGLLGLSFEPTEDRGVPDIRGVLWLDPANAELQWLDYRYQYLDVPSSERLGGRIRFHGLPNGTWIVSEWYIRMPVLQALRRRGRVRTRLVGLKEEGGVVVRASNLQGDAVLDLGAGIVEGVVLDSEGSEPVEEVVVLLGDSTRVTTDGDGRFRFTALVEGYYGLRVFNPVLDSLGFSAEPVFLEVRPGDVASVRLRFSSLDAVLTEECIAEPPGVGVAIGQVDFSENRGILTGFALLDTGEPATGAQVSVRWQEVVERGLGGLTRLDESLTTTELREDGFFLMCGVPRERPVEIITVWNGVESRPESLELSGWQRVSRRDPTIRRRR